MTAMNAGRSLATEILVKDDDWLGVIDPVERKKRQNRLHQRAWRRRKALEKAETKHCEEDRFQKSVVGTKRNIPKHHFESHIVHRSRDMATLVCLRKMAEDHVSGRHRLATTFDQQPQHDSLWTTLETLGQSRALLAYWGDLQAHRRDELMSSIDGHITAAGTSISVDHHLFCMIQYIALRGVMANMHLLLRLQGFQPSQDKWDVLYTEGVTSLPDHAPVSLLPTPLQRSVMHEAWIDVIPSPAMRDNIIRLQDSIDVDSLCADLLGSVFEQAPDGNGCDRGLVLWGEPWAVANWEVGDKFVHKWACLLQGCNDLLDATNRWRGIRGEKGVVVEVESE